MTFAVTWEVLGEVLGERVHQVEERGWDSAHDDRQSIQAWAWLLLRRVSELSLPVELSGPYTAEDSRRLLLEIAAISVAALESLTRLASTMTGADQAASSQPPWWWTTEGADLRE